MRCYATRGRERATEYREGGICDHDGELVLFVFIFVEFVVIIDDLRLKLSQDPINLTARVAGYRPFVDP